MFFLLATKTDSEYLIALVEHAEMFAQPVTPSMRYKSGLATHGDIAW